ncbi:hypothetical protein MYU51_013449 [Penicillium brevicompactum]|uniref:uncharacterized protein n=1 Tax=Penicillium brevicompactum TaxID=5074 RepID=UPI00253F7875|nr:uncharacterized protein N7506_012019 [Penicillium brevicompactum]KAJ5319315.1 hypothetical protein N7506_012019 [Penicillium brevicompactum]
MAPSLSKEEISQRMRDLVFGGHLGPAQGKAITFDIVREDPVSIIFIAALISFTEVNAGLDRYLISLAKDGALLSTSPVSLNTGEMAKLLLESGCGKLVEYERFKDGSFGTTYKAKARGKNKDEPNEYIVQLRYHANIDNMYHLIKYVREKSPGGLPVPQMFPTPTSSSSVLGVQISQYVPGHMGSAMIDGLSLEGKRSVVKQMAQAFAALWELPTPGTGNLIGEAIVSPEGTVSVGPERRYGLGGPFSSVTSYLQAWIKHRLDKLQGQQAIDEYKDKYLDRIIRFAETTLNHIPFEVENVQLALVHTDLGLHNMIFSESPTPILKGAIDWEFVDYAPLLIVVPTLVEPTFELFASESGDLRQAFWDEIPLWKRGFASKGSRIFLDFYSFGLYLKADALPDRNADLAAKEQYWKKNIEFVEGFLGQWENLQVSV